MIRTIGYGQFIVAILLTWIIQRCHSYCPPLCSCTTNNSSDDVLGAIFNIIVVDCDVTEDGFHINEEADSVLRHEQMPMFLSYSIICVENVHAVWTNASFLSKTFKLTIIGCDLSRNQGRNIIFPQSSDLRVLTFKDNGGEKFFQEMEIQGIAKLQELTISNGLSKIPDSLYRHRTSQFLLSHIDLSNNKLTDIQCPFFAHRIFLNTIKLNDNLIKTVPSCFCNIYAKYSVDLTSNYITDISNVVCMTQVKHLRLTFNNIAQVPKFPRQSDLLTLDLSYNEISLLKRNTFADLPNLQTLELSHNIIAQIEPFTFGNIPMLLFLYLNRNELIEFDLQQAPSPDRMIPLDLEIYLGENKLKYPPYHSNNYFFPKNFQTNAQNNPYQCDCEIEHFQEAHLYGRLSSFKNNEGFTCKTPRNLAGKTLLSLNLTSTCTVMDNCPNACTCERDQTTHITTVGCASRNLTNLPLKLPQGSLILQLSDNRIEELKDHDYFHRLLELDLSNNGLRTMSDIALVKLTNITTLKLNGNRLRTLPRSTETWSVQSLRQLALHDNLWECTCDTMWFRDWLIQLGSVVQEPDSIMCFKDDEEWKPIKKAIILCSDYIPLAITVSSVSAVLMLAAVLMYIYRMEMKLLIFTRLNWHPFDRTEILNKKYDAFISYSEEDSMWVRRLIQLLEVDHDPPYITCFHHRDFIPGVSTAANIEMAVHDSQCTIIVLSPAFVQSEWCMFEFQVAHACLMDNEIGKVIIIIKEDIEVKKLQPDLKSYLRTMTYVKASDKWFSEKLYYALPQKDKITCAELQPISL